jgi:large subunit ribosomal protein L25
VSAHEVKLELRQGARVVSLDLGGAQKQYLIKAIQYDHLDKDPVHIDFARVDLDERVRVKVAIELRGVPEGAKDGGVLDLVHDTIELECTAISIPDMLRPSVVHLNVGDSLTAGEIELPDGVTLITAADEKIAILHEAATASDADDDTEVEDGATPSEPERIGRVADTEDSKD